MKCECGTEMEFIGTNWVCPKCSGKMDTREELERIIREAIMKESSALEYIKGYWDTWVKIIAQSILSKLPELGYVRLEDVEIDEGKLTNFLKYRWVELECIDECHLERLAKAIASAKPIKIREGK